MTYDETTTYDYPTPRRCPRCGTEATQFQRPDAATHRMLCPTCGPVALGTQAAIADRVAMALAARGHADAATEASRIVREAGR